VTDDRNTVLREQHVQFEAIGAGRNAGVECCDGILRAERRAAGSLKAAGLAPWLLAWLPATTARDGSPAMR
jgi:hypothetical protein